LNLITFQFLHEPNSFLYNSNTVIIIISYEMDDTCLNSIIDHGSNLQDKGKVYS